MRHIKLIGILGFALLLTACSTTRTVNGQPKYCLVERSKMPVVETHVVHHNPLYDCAKVTLDNGFAYFVIVGGDATPAYRSYTTSSTYNQYANTRLAICRKGGRHSSMVLIKMYGDSTYHPSSLHDASALLR